MRRRHLLALAVAVARGPAPPAPPMTTELRVDGMVCASCEAAIAAEVGKLPGVDACAADHQAGTVVVRHDARVTVDAIAAAITKLGYTVRAGP